MSDYNTHDKAGNKYGELKVFKAAVDDVIAHPSPTNPSEETETFKHMVTVLMIMFGDARQADVDRGEELEKEAFEYAESWLKEHDEALIRQEVLDFAEGLEKQADEYLTHHLAASVYVAAVPLSAITAAKTRYVGGVVEGREENE